MRGRAPSIRLFRFTSVLLASVLLAAGISLPAGAEDLLQVYREAQRSDATFAAARSALEAGRERQPQGLSLIHISEPTRH